MDFREEAEQLVANIRADGERMRQRMQELEERRAARAEADRWPQSGGGAMLARETPPPTGGNGLDGRLDRFEQTLIAMARDVGQLKGDVGELKNDVGQLKGDVGQLKNDVGQLKNDVGQLKEDVVQLKGEVRERLATKVALEGMHDSVRVVAEGYAHTQKRLDDVAELLRRYLTA